MTAVGPTGPVFRTFDSRGHLTAARLDSGDVARVLRRRTGTAGVAGDFAGHSFTARVHYEPGEEERPIESIKRVTGQRSSRIGMTYGAAATVYNEPPLLEIIDGE